MNKVLRFHSSKVQKNRTYPTILYKLTIAIMKCFHRARLLYPITVIRLGLSIIVTLIDVDMCFNVRFSVYYSLLSKKFSVTHGE